MFSKTKFVRCCNILLCAFQLTTLNASAQFKGNASADDVRVNQLVSQMTLV